MFFNKNQKKLDPRRRFGSREFRNKIKEAQGYKREVFFHKPDGLWEKILFAIGLRSRLIRYSLLVGLLIVLYFLVISSYLRINDVTVTGNGQVASETIIEAINKTGNSRTALIPNDHYFLMTKGRVNKTLTQQIPLIKEVVELNRSWPNKLEIKITERSPGFALKLKEKFYLVDEEGVIINEIPDSKGLLVIEDSVDENIAIREELNPKMIAFVLSMKHQWPSKISSSLQTIKIPGKASTEAQFVSAEGWSTFFDINRPVLSQLGNLALILNKQIPAKDRLQLVYIDLRLAKWAYICFKNTPCEQQPQQSELNNEEQTTDEE